MVFIDQKNEWRIKITENFAVKPEFSVNAFVKCITVFLSLSHFHADLRPNFSPLDHVCSFIRQTRDDIGIGIFFILYWTMNYQVIAENRQMSTKLEISGCVKSSSWYVCTEYRLYSIHSTNSHTHKISNPFC